MTLTVDQWEFFVTAQDVFKRSRHFLHFEVAMHDAIADHEFDKVFEEDELRDMIIEAWDDLTEDAKQ